MILIGLNGISMRRLHLVYRLRLIHCQHLVHYIVAVIVIKLPIGNTSLRLKTIFKKISREKKFFLKFINFYSDTVDWFIIRLHLLKNIRWKMIHLKNLLQPKDDPIHQQTHSKQCRKKYLKKLLTKNHLKILKYPIK